MDRKFSPIKKRVFEYLDYKKIARMDFYNMSSISPSNFKGKGVESELGGEKIAKILTIFDDINPEWLLTGKLPMLKHVPCKAKEHYLKIISGESSAYHIVNGIPLISHAVAAGFGTVGFSINNEDVKAYYAIPIFKERRVDFLIEVAGDSMSPRYNNGDVIACSIMNEFRFMQWNKLHAIAIKGQGILLKRVMEVENNSIIAVSDNPDYPPLKIPKNEITGIALVVGVVRLE